MNNLKSLQEKVKEEFRSGFWLHRVPRFTKQAKDIEEFIDSSLAQAYELGRKDFRNLRFETDIK